MIFTKVILEMPIHINHFNLGLLKKIQIKTIETGFKIYLDQSKPLSKNNIL